MRWLRWKRWRREHRDAVALLEYALHLRMHGERAPGGNETWQEFDRRCEAYLRALPVPAPIHDRPAPMTDDDAERFASAFRPPAAYRPLGTARWATPPEESPR